MSIIKCDKCGLLYEFDNGIPCRTCKILKEPKMNAMVKYEINKLATKIFHFKGEVAFAKKVHDFSKPTSEYTKEVWNLAVLAYATLKDREDLLEYMVK